jgi:endonuclease YncB( thermonuclease family)
MIAAAAAVILVPTPEEGGQTMMFIMANQASLRVRLFGIDLPEQPRRDPQGRLTAPGQPYGDAAAAGLAGLVQGRRLRLEIYGVDRARRVLGTLFRDPDNLNLALVEAGLAEVYRGSSVTDPINHSTMRRKPPPNTPGAACGPSVRSTRVPARIGSGSAEDNPGRE